MSERRLNQVGTKPPFTCTCYGCSKRLQVAPDKPPVYADADGPPFKAYYCAACANAWRIVEALR